MRNAWILAYLVLGAALFAAQGASGASPFATAMNNVCRTANLRVANVGVSESLFELDTNEPLLLAADKAKVAALDKLGKAPVHVAPPFAVYLLLQRKIDGLESKMISAAKHVKLSTVEKLQSEVAGFQKTHDAAARKVGAPACLSTAT